MEEASHVAADALIVHSCHLPGLSAFSKHLAKENAVLLSLAKEESLEMIGALLTGDIVLGDCWVVTNTHTKLGCSTRNMQGNSLELD